MFAVSILLNYVGIKLYLSHWTIDSYQATGADSSCYNSTQTKKTFKTSRLYSRYSINKGKEGDFTAFVDNSEELPKPINHVEETKLNGKRNKIIFETFSESSSKWQKQKLASFRESEPNQKSQVAGLINP